MSSSTIIHVNGMTCGHCVTAVTNAVGNLDGVTGVEVDLDSGTVQITSIGPLDNGDVTEAIHEAGYEATP